ncbi:MAG: hypothetical protein V4482_03490 [Pseudomonadota bacterium]
MATQLIHWPLKNAVGLISIYDKRNELGSDDVRFNHFEILRLTEKLSRKLIDQINMSGTFDIAFICESNDEERYENIFDYSDIKQNTFRDWFVAVLDNHNKGSSMLRSINAVSEEIRIYKQENKKIVLVLGAAPDERHHFNLDANNGFDQEPGIIYVDANRKFGDQYAHMNNRAGIVSKAVWDKQFIHGDFTEIELHKMMLQQFGACFDLIIPDLSVMKYKLLTVENLEFFCAMLKVDGNMIFDNTDCTSGFYDSETKIMAFGEKRFKLVSDKLEMAISPRSRVWVPATRDTFRSERGMSPYYRVLLRTQYKDYIEKFNKQNMSDNCTLSVCEGMFPYWNSRGNEITYLEMRKLS